MQEHTIRELTKLVADVRKLKTESLNSLGLYATCIAVAGAGHPLLEVLHAISNSGEVSIALEDYITFIDMNKNDHEGTPTT